ncbi:MAG TPA: AAA family ATPase [Polyangiaceae bacterium]|jgi:hypothetical protein
MRLASLQLFGMGPLTGAKLAFGEQPRAMTVLFGGDGVGKTSVLAAIGSTRPGHAIPLVPRRARIVEDEPREVPFAVSEWMLGDDDTERPHSLRVVSPNAQLGDQDGEATLRRREQALFDKRAHEHGGYAFTAFSGARWFSRAPLVLASPERTVMRYDPRVSPSFDDATRADMTRDVKQALAFAAIGAALEKNSGEVAAFDAALREVASVVLAPFRAEYTGAHPKTLEPLFAIEHRDAIFEDLPRGARHLLAIATLSVRTLAAAYAGAERPVREREGLVVVDDLEAQQDARLLRHLPALLKTALPRVQWIVTTSSPAVTLGCERGEVIALRREPEGERVVVHDDAFAILH